MRPVVFGLLAALFATTVAPAADAQFYVQTERAEPYASLAQRGASISSFSFSAADEGTATLTLPFSFSYFGEAQTEVWISTNGVLQFGAGTRPGFSNRTIAAAPDGIIAVWWDDLVLRAEGLSGRTAVLNSSPNRIFVVEVDQWDAFSGDQVTEGAYQVWFYEGPLGRFEVRYGLTLSAAEPYSATAGHRSVDGSRVAAYRPCAEIDGLCNAAVYASLSDRVIAVELADEAELVGEVGTIPPGGLPGQVITVPVEVRNLGPVAAPASEAAVFLSTDGTLDPADVEIGRVPVAAIGAEQTLALDVDNTIPAGTAAANYRILLEVDAGMAVTEEDETNNVSASATLFPTASDFTLTAVVPPAAAAPLGTMGIDLTVDNLGLPYTGIVDVTVKLSPDPINDVTDPVLATVPVTLTGQPSEVVNVTVDVPDVQSGLYFVVGFVDPADQIRELAEGNNILASAVPVRIGPDVTVTDIAGPPGGLPGDSVSITTSIGSIGAPYTGPVGYALYLSSDDVFDAQDPLLGTFSANLAAASVSDTQSVVLPENAVGDFRFVARADPAAAIVEADETNNTFVDGDIASFGVDLRILSINFSPRTILANGTFDYTATLRVAVNPFDANVAYRVYLSRDGQLDPTDRLVDAGEVAVDDQDDFPIAGTVDLSSLDPPPFPGRYTVIITIDPDDAFVERDETNNVDDSFSDLVIQGPDLLPVEFAGAAQGFVGQNYTLSATVRNDGDAPAPSFGYAYYIVTDGDLANGTRIGGGTIGALAPSATTQVNDVVALSAALAPGQVQIGIVVDPDGDVDEGNELNNGFLMPSPVTLRNPVPDLTAEVLEATSSAAPGETLSVTSALRNTGFIAASGFVYEYVLVAVSDEAEVAIGRGSSSLPVGGRSRPSEVLTVPPTLATGVYRLDLIVDPDGLIEEVDESNNRWSGPAIEIFSADLRVSTATLAEGRVGVPYSADLRTEGGTASVQWQLVAGALPATLNLSADGRISGTPSVEGAFSFTIQASSGGRTAQRMLSLIVRTAEAPLAVVASSLPNALVGRPYETSLLAVGGLPPLSWSATGLPTGLSLASNGTLSGTPRAVEELEFEAEVVDAVGARSAATLRLRVVDPGATVRISTALLPPAVVGQPYCAPNPVRMTADGGTPPYAWSSTDLPTGFSLSTDGQLCGTAVVTGRFWAVVTVADAAGQIDTASIVVDVLSTDSVLIRTVSLPDAVDSTPYLASLEAAGGTAPYTWAVELGELPPGLLLSAAGRLSGQSDAPGRYAFAVRVTDAVGVSVRRALSIDVVRANASVSSTDGCRCVGRGRQTGTTPTLVGLGLGAVALGRRRRRPRSARS